MGEPTEDSVPSRSRLVDFLVIIFGSSSWIAINGLWVQTPLLVNQLPESWNLPSWIVVLTQIANIGPIVFGLLRSRGRFSEVPAIHFIMGLGFLCCILMSSLWNRIEMIAGKERSVGFLALTGILALVDCSSSVLYFPFISNFHSVYLQSLLVGEGLSGLVPSIVALIQGVGGNPYCKNVTQSDGSWKWVAVRNAPRFSIEVFFYILSGLLLLSWVSFFALTRSKRGKVKHQSQSSLQSSSDASTLTLTSPTISNHYLTILLVIQALCCCLMNGILSALQTYSTLPYGNVTHHLATTLSVISGPVAVFLVFVLQNQKTFVRPIPPLLALGSVAVVYIIYLATQSPHPPFQDSFLGATLVVVAWVVYHGSYSYVKACIAGRLRQSPCEGRRALFYYGVATQVGSLIGSFSIFIVINATHVFKSYQPCKQ